MTRSAFTKPGGYEVDRTRYGRHRKYPYHAFGPAAGKIRRAPLRSGKPKEGRRRWQNAAGGPIPLVQLGIRNPDTYRGHKDVWTLVDTGAYVTVLSAEAADRLGLNRHLRRREVMKIVKDVTGRPFVGLRRWVYLHLGGRLLLIPVLVPPDPRALDNPDDVPIAPNFCLLGRARVLNEFLLCLDAEGLYVFPRQSRRK